MKLVSKTALGFALAIGSVSMVAVAPVNAAKKEKKEEAKPAKLTLSKEFRAAFAPVDKAYQAKDNATVLTLLNTIEATATTPDDKYVLNQYRVNAASVLQNTAEQDRGVNGMIASGQVPAADLPKYQFFAGKFAAGKKDYAKAEAMLAAAQAGGYATTDLYLTLATTYSAQAKYAQTLSALQNAVDLETKTTGKAPAEWYQFGFSQAYKGKLNTDFVKWSSNWLRAYPSVENWRTALVNYRDSQSLGGKIELDVYRLLRATKSLAGEKDHYDYAYLSNQAGLPGEAKAAADLFKTSGNGATSRPLSEIGTEAGAKVTGDKAGLPAEEKAALTSGSATRIVGVANAYLGYGDYAKAATLYQTAVGKTGIDADEVNTRLGIALILSGQKDAARAAFNAIKGPRAGLAQYWLVFVDQAI